MDAELDTLRRRMEAAAKAEDYEEARRLQGLIAERERAQGASGSRLRRQEPGKMGLGTSEAEPLRPKGWTPPPKPDLMTTGTRPAKHRR